MSHVLAIDGLSKTYPNGVRALHDVSLRIPTGMFGLLGPNGAGKSTLMRTIATLQEPDSGRITLGNTIPFSESIGFIARLDEDDEEAIDLVETEIPVDDWIDLAVFGDHEPGASPQGKLLALEKRKIDGAEAVFELVIDEEPRRAGIDPFTKLIDRNPDNNVAGVSAADGS